MVSAAHHVTIATRDASATLRFFGDVLGLAVHDPRPLPSDGAGPLLNGTPTADARSTMLGSAVHGLVEVLEIPTLVETEPIGHLDEQLSGGVVGISFAVRNVVDCLAASRVAGFIDRGDPETVVFGDIRLLVAAVLVDRVAIQLTQVLDPLQAGADRCRAPQPHQVALTT